jgi:CRISPR-associated endonuclease Csn1
LPYASGQIADGKTKDPESTVLVKIPAWQELRKTLVFKELTSEWQRIATDALDGKPQLFDQIAWVLSGRAQTPSATFLEENVAWKKPISS